MIFKSLYCEENGAELSGIYFVSVFFSFFRFFCISLVKWFYISGIYHIYHITCSLLHITSSMKYPSAKLFQKSFFVCWEIYALYVRVFTFALFALFSVYFLLPVHFHLLVDVYTYFVCSK